MNPWIEECLRLLKISLGNPATDLEMGFIILFGAVAFVLALAKIADMLGAQLSDKLRAVMVLAVGVVLTLVICTAADMYIAPKLGNADLRKYLPLITAVVVFFLVIIPITCFIKKASYMVSLFSLLLTCAATAVVIALVASAFDAVKIGNKGLNPVSERKDSINKIMLK